MSRWALIVAALLGAACPADPPELILDCPEDAGTPVTLTEVYGEVHGPVCSNCHFPGSQEPVMSSGAALAATVNAESAEYAPLHYVVPGDLRQSLMYLKVMGGTDAGYSGPNGEDTGALMPRGGPPLSDPQKDVLRRWICQGAATQ